MSNLHIVSIPSRTDRLSVTEGTGALAALSFFGRRREVTVFHPTLSLVSGAPGDNVEDAAADDVGLRVPLLLAEALDFAFGAVGVAEAD